MTAPGDPSTRVAALEVKTDATREAVNALGEKLAAHQQETRENFRAVRDDLTELRRETRSSFRSVEEHFAEIRDLIINGRGRR